MSHNASPPERPEWPSRQEWERVRPVITNLYCQQGWRLKKVQKALQEQYSFVATEPMYKTRLRLWGATKKQMKQGRKNTPETPRPIPADASGWTSVQAVASPYRTSGSSDRIASDSSAVLVDAPQFESTSVEGQGLNHHQNGDAHRNVDAFSMLVDQTSAPSLLGPAEAQHSPDQTSFEPQSLQHGAVSTRYVNNWLAQPPGEGVSTTRRPILPRDESPPVPVYNFPIVRANPDAFLDCLSRYCRLCDTKDQRSADDSASHGFSMYTQLLREGHRRVLTCLNTVVVCVTVFNRVEQAVDLMLRARDAALGVMPFQHPVIQAIDFLTLQAAGKYDTTPIYKMRQAHIDMSGFFARNHPNVLMTGYLLAWRLSLERNHRLEAIQLLNELQIAADSSLGPNNLLAIAMLTARSRLQHSLNMMHDAIANQKDALRRMGEVYPSHHPYVLNARSRFGDMLFVACRDDETEVELLACALGRVEVFGRENERSHRDIREVERFFVATKRESRRDWFHRAIHHANNGYLARAHTHAQIVDGLRTTTP